MSLDNKKLLEQLATELKANVQPIEKAIALLDEGATVPFIARYRKEATGGLDDGQLRMLVDRLSYLRELQERKEVILASIREQDKLDPPLEQAIVQAQTKTLLEDLYLPFRPKRRTRAQAAREAGLGPLAQQLLQHPEQEPLQEASKFVNVEVQIEDANAALEGAKQIIMEHLAEDAHLLEQLREAMWQQAILHSSAKKNAKEASNKFRDYLDYSEPVRKIPSHRALALFRGRREQLLQVELQLPPSLDGLAMLQRHFSLENHGRPGDALLQDCAQMAWKVKIWPKLELEIMTRLRELADAEAIRVFAKNLHDLLLAAPAGQQVTMGLDPGIRTGVKVAVVDATGKLLDYTTIYPFAPQNDWHGSVAELARLAARHHVNLISIGNGTASRESEKLVAEMMKTYPDLALQRLVVSEAGASVYSASALAAEEFPDLDVSIRGAVSIARRLQDPLAELVKIEPKAIGVGQYQHDVNPLRLSRSLEAVVEDCVNAVGVDVNTASIALLSRISGLNEGLAKNIVAWRDNHGRFQNRQQLLEVPRLGEKTWQQAIGFLRIVEGDNPLDASAVHPEAYPLVEQILQKENIRIGDLLGNSTRLRAMNAASFVDVQYGLPTVKDVFLELEKPGRDPRPEFRMAIFQDGIEDIKDLELGMILEGVISNITNFGVFVDIGVHQDGLVHISEMTDKFIRDPHKIAKTGDIVKVRVLEVDKERRRIGLSMRLEEKKEVPVKALPPKAKEKTAQSRRPLASLAKPEKAKADIKEKKKEKPIFNTAMADALARWKKGS